MRDLSRVLLLLPVLLACGGLRAETPAQMTDYDPLSSAYLEAVGARIGAIIIENDNIFDLDDPRENNFLFRTANRLHIRTLPRIIHRQLLFRSGDAYSQRLLEESERILRSNQYLENARIEPVHYADGWVDVRVRTTDVWTLKPRIDFGRNGGTNNGTYGFEESNLMGTGSSLSLLHDSSVDREANLIRYQDRELGSTRYSLLAEYSDSDEGSGHLVDLGLPFYALDSRRAHGMSLQSDNRIDTLYDRGDAQAEFRHREDEYAVHAGFSGGLKNGWVTRYSVGLGFSEHRFSPDGDTTLPGAGLLPEDRRYVYPFVAVEIIEDDYAVLMNHDQIGRVEDILYGSRLDLQLGYAGTAFGSHDNALLLKAGTSRGFGDPGADSLYTSAELSMRFEDGQVQNMLLTPAAGWYHRHSPRRTLYSGLTANIGSNLDLDNPLYIGGDNGLRGYPLRYQGGDRSVLFTIEERYFTNWYPFRLFRIGGAVFFDIGRTWGDNPVGAENLGWLKDAGFGLRIGNNRSGTGKVIHIDLAFPFDGEDDIDSMQFIVEARATY